MQIIHNIPIHSYERERRKTLSIHITPRCEVKLKVPLNVSEQVVHDFVLRKKKWIEKKLEYFAQFEDVLNVELSSGQKILYLGQKYTLIIKDCIKNAVVEGVVIEDHNLLLYTKKAENTRYNERILDRWFLMQAERIFHERLSLAMQSFPNLARPVLKIKKYKSRWGSYASNHVMTLNSELIHAEMDAIDYVILHELCHYYYKGHDATFYDLLVTKMPNWKEVRTRLNDGHLGI